MTMEWLSCYIYYEAGEGRAEQLLKEEIGPLIVDLMKKKLVDQFFFIRYGDKKGAHIRLRFKGEAQVLEKKVKPLLEAKFPDIRCVTYRPEYTRYGGKAGIEIAEKLFESSSKAVLTFLSEQKTPSYERSLGMALQLNLSMLHAFGMDKKELVAFFEHTLDAKKLDNYKNHLAPQEQIVLLSLHQLWSALEQKQHLASSWFTDWQQELTDIAGKLQVAFKANKLNPLDPKKAHQANPMWYLYESFVHMNNNRLGISHHDEPYISYILLKGLTYE